MEEKQLPEEVVKEIEIKAQEYARTYSGTKLINRPYIAGAIDYATKLHQANETIKDLERWKAEAICLLSKIDDYADGHPEIKLGMCKVEFTIERAIKFDALKPLLEEVLKLDAQDIAYISEDLIQKIKTFLYGE